MITKEQIEQAAQEHIKEFGVWKVQSISPGEEANAANFDFSRGAKWAIEQMQASVQEGAELIVKWVKAYESEKADNIRLSGENTRLRDLLHDVASQIKSFSEITNGGKIPSIWRPIVNEIENALK